MPNVKCITMQKDEALLLAPWLRYHGYLFGFENLIVIDNGSVLSGVRQTLETFEQVGVRVFRQFTSPTDYLRKGPITADAIRIIDHQAEYDFILPLDCDEFLALWQPDGVTCDRSAIHDSFAALDRNETHFRIGNCLYNDPSRPGWFWPQDALKGFMRSRSVRSLDHGCHTFSDDPNFEMAPCEFTHLHFHHKPFDMMKEHARWKLNAFVNVDDKDALRAFIGPGKHLVRNLLSDAAEYRRQFHDHLTFSFPGFSDLMTVLGIENDMMTDRAPRRLFSGDVLVRRSRDYARGLPQEQGETVVLNPIAYRDANFDVAAAGVNPLRHFLFLGNREQRALE